MDDRTAQLDSGGQVDVISVAYLGFVKGGAKVER